MSNKNPFELRFDVMSMAKDMLDQAYSQQMDVMYQQLEIAKEQSKDLQEVFEKYTPKMYQPQEILEKAEELYKFVSKKEQ